MNGYETSSTEDSLDHSSPVSLEEHYGHYPDILDSGLSKRPPFLETSPKRDPNLGGFIDEGNATLLRDDFSICCEAYFYGRHKLQYSSYGEYPDYIGKKLRQHIASPEFLTARTLFLSAIEQEILPELAFLLWELYGYDPNRFTECLQTLRALQSAPSSLLSNIEILCPLDSPTGLRELQYIIDYMIKKLEQDLNISSHDMGLQFLQTLSAEMIQLRHYHDQFSKIESPLCRNEWLDRFWNEEARDHWIVSPYEYGLNYFLYRELQVIDQSSRFLLPKRSSHLSAVTVENAAPNVVENEASSKDAYIRLLFGVAGCGKTKSIFDILSSNWGLYILPGGRSESLSGRTLQTDSVLLWSTISKVNNSFGNVCGDQEIREVINRLVQAFLACRLREFKRMYQLEYSSSTNKDLCMHWLQYQLTTSGMNDNHFKRYFAIARHLPQSRIGLLPGGNEYPDSDIFPNWLPRERFYFCLDEFQSDFDRQAEACSVPAGHKYNPTIDGLMHTLFGSTIQLKEDHAIQEGLQWKIILAGTSSYLSEVTRAMKPYKRIAARIAQSDVFYEIHSKFERIKNFQDEFPQFLLAHTDQVLSEAWAIIKTTYESGMAISRQRSIHSERIRHVDGNMSSSNWDCLQSSAIRITRRIRDVDANMSSSDWDCLQSSALLITSGRHVPRRLRLALLGLFNKTQGKEAAGIKIIFQSLRQKIRAEQKFITKIGLPLRGRHLWSSTYAQLILAIAIEYYVQSSDDDFQKKLQFSDEDFEKKLQDPVTKIEKKTIEALRLSLKKLRETNRLIYSHICRLAIRADALNQPTLFPDDYTGEMVTRGFAFAYSDPNNSRWKEGYVKIGEPLAIRAVLEYLQRDEQGKIEFKRQTNEIVYMNQDNASGLGFSTEYYLATNFDAVFRRGVELVSTDRRDKVKNYLQKNTSLIDDGSNSLWSSSCNALQINDFELTQPAIDDSKLGKNASFVKWLEQPPDASKFCYPSTKAGPDLAFILNRNSTKSQAAPQINKILVTVQSKTAEQKTSAGFDVVETMHTIDPNLWYISSPTCVPATKDIVQRWGTDPSCLILSILVVTSDFVVAGADEKCRTYRTEEHRRRRCEEQHPAKPSASDDYEGKRVGRPNMAQELLRNLPNITYAFCVIDRDMTQHLFGDAFTKLIDMAKKKPVKRAAPEDDNLPETEGPQIKRIKLTPTPRRCTACGTAGHMKNSSRCPTYQHTLDLRQK